MHTIQHPTNSAYKGKHGTGLVFADGQAETDDPKLVRYFQAAGFVVNGEQRNAAPAGEVPTVADPRDHPAPYMQGPPLRDAAVDPRPGDIGPTNAGVDNPHGPTVVQGNALARHRQARIEAEAAAAAELEALEKEAKQAAKKAAKKAAPTAPPAA